MKCSNCFAIVLDFFKKSIFRMLSGLCLFVLYILLHFCFEPPSGKGFILFIKEYWNWTSLFILLVLGFLSLGLDYFNTFVPDRISISCDRLLAKYTWGGFGSYFGKKYMERASKTSFFIRVDDLDEIIHRLYDSAHGEIYLFNPPKDLINSIETKWKDIREAISNNKNNITRIIISVPQNDGFLNKEHIAVKLKIKPEQVVLQIINNEELKIFAKYFRMGIYYKKEKNDEKIEYFLYRPIKMPYDDNFVLVQDYKVLNKMISPNTDDVRLYENVRKLKSILFP